MQQWDKKLIRAAGKCRAVAFDVFDTLLMRDVARPQDLFALMEETCAAGPGFAQNRRQAEAQARTPGVETTLAAIYAQPPLRGAEPEAECAAELRAVVPRAELVRAAKACREHGYKIYIISDMYLPAAQIDAMLRRCGVDFADGVFVSSEYGVQKRSGKLFRLFLQKTGLRARDVLFVGNDRRADWGGAALAGIRCLLVPPPTAPAHYAPPTTVQEGALWAFVQNRVQGMDPARYAGYAMAGPMLTAFARWLHDRRGERPGSRIVMLARDMDLVRRVYAGLYPDEPEPGYLRVSRRSLCPALLQRPMNEEGLNLLADALPRQVLTAAQVLEYCSFAPGAWPGGVDTQETVDLRTRPLTAHTREFLLGMAALSKTSAGISVRCQAELARAYLHDFFPQDGRSVLLVDIGSGGTTQRALKALGVTGLFGACLACDGRLREHFSGDEAEAFLFEGKPAPLWYWVGQPMLERLISEPCGATVGYAWQRGAVQALMGPYEPSDVVKTVQQAALDFAADWQAGPWADMGLPAGYAAGAFLELVRAPRLTEAAQLGDLTVEDGGTWPLAAPKAGRHYLRHPKDLGRDLRTARWKTAFLRRALRLPLPYDRLYAAMSAQRRRGAV